MKKLLFFAATLLFAGMIQAQQKSTSDNYLNSEAAGANFEKFSQELQLTETQKSEILSIYEKYNKKKTEIRGTGTPEQFKALKEAEEKDIQSVLNEDQIKKMDRIKIQDAKDNKAKELKGTIK
ncbi:MAG: hypothetical protein H3C39_00955 [Flavobacteriia bacterium]|nr:hypothetical protein [Flavobacteriia bacterium]